MTTDDRESDCRIRLSGRITIDSSPGLREFLLTRLKQPSCQSLTLDFGEVSYVDTSGLAILVETLTAARSLGKGMRLNALRERHRYLLEITRLLSLFDEVDHK